MTLPTGAHGEQRRRLSRGVTAVSSLLSLGLFACESGIDPGLGGQKPTGIEPPPVMSTTVMPDGGVGQPPPTFVEMVDAGRIMPPTSCGGQACEQTLPDPFCGDGVISGTEECDDGNIEPGDGCSPLCVQADNYACVEGQLCVSTVVCGDSMLSPGEGCDDGNTAAGDGCDAACQVEPGWICPIIGVRCSATECGDGIIAGLEECEGDGVSPGCSATCTVQPGYACVNADTSPPSTCHVTTCGDGTMEGGEQCDDGNLFPFDGCSPSCQLEPTCAAGSACSSACGDGLVIGEQCDDGNVRDGDGCSSLCELEPGFVCNNDPIVKDTLDIPVMYRDYKGNELPGGHPNFHWAGNPDPMDGSPTPFTAGLVDVLLDADGKPTYAGWDGSGVDPHIDSQAMFATWYRDNQYGIPIPDILTLTNPGTGTFTFDSQLFFPLDERGWAVTAPVEQPFYSAYVDDMGMWQGGPLHYFFFTSEIHYWFRYDPAAAASLFFRGDDDVWVFVKGHLVVDIGGIHAPVQGSVTFDENTLDTAGTGLDLVPGEVYEIAVFQAERNPGASSYRLELSGFNDRSTSCTPMCGDGVVTSGERCDNGDDNEDGLYGGCSTTCTLGPFCGDGMINGPEQCDLGAGNISTYGSAGCAPGCIAPPRCGDGIVQTDREECDLGDEGNVGGYNGCREDCQFGPFCGDGNHDIGNEECDDGNRTPDDGCSPVCTKPIQ